jgi:hypothetical protein
LQKQVLNSKIKMTRTQSSSINSSKDQFSNDDSKNSALAQQAALALHANHNDQKQKRGYIVDVNDLTELKEDRN